jgi:hypothetical protein
MMRIKLQENKFMKTKTKMCSAAAFLAVIAVVIAGWHTIAIAQSHPATTVEVPKFEVDPAWPKIPNGWVLGQVSSAASDEQDNIWVLHRPGVVRPGQKTGPPVMEFDQAGNYIRGWGGPGTGYDWPEVEHGIFIDYKGFVWIGGSGVNDGILKFTKDGKFLMQIGHATQKKSNQDTKNFWRPADVFVYPKTNELFVADGYNNKRIIVFDADNGEYKRMWGAFGNAPKDDPETAVKEGGRKGGPDLDRIPAKDIDPKDPGPSQFNTVHGVKVSNDGLVYVAERGNKRVQVFTIDGKFVAQTFIDRFCEAPHCGNGQTTASVSRTDLGLGSKNVATSRFFWPTGRSAWGILCASPHDNRFKRQSLCIRGGRRSARSKVCFQGNFARAGEIRRGETNIRERRADDDCGLRFEDEQVTCITLPDSRLRFGNPGPTLKRSPNLPALFFCSNLLFGGYGNQSCPGNSPFSLFFYEHAQDAHFHGGDEFSIGVKA